ncbi:hypothetical protein, partial [Mycobacterium xenopi]|uniref:hypothetical protein n=1 Tax=Mycobacterium xenopi TaxID=1789 RepID=UPI0022EA1589
MARRHEGQAAIQIRETRVAFVGSQGRQGALRPKTDEAGALVGLQWGAGLVVPIAPAAVSGRRGREQQAE